ncbi:MAG: endonuclease domain-containing protein [Syntrophales bacterium]
MFPLPLWERVRERGEAVPINLTDAAKELRRSSTDAERLLWQRLKAKQLKGLKFRRQEQIGRFIADFVCYEKSIIIEADGGQHALEKEKDAERTQWLNSQGFTVLRFWNNEILTNIDGVMEAIRMQCETPLPDPLPPGERGIGN